MGISYRLSIDALEIVHEKETRQCLFNPYSEVPVLHASCCSAFMCPH